jgi:hypothetical protein
MSSPPAGRLPAGPAYAFFFALPCTTLAPVLRTAAAISSRVEAAVQHSAAARPLPSIAESLISSSTRLARVLAHQPRQIVHHALLAARHAVAAVTEWK